MRKPLLLSFALAVAAALAAAQQPKPAAAQFDVVSIHPAPSIQQVIASHQMPHAGTRIDAGRVDIGFASLKDLICSAYKVKPWEVSGPAYLDTARFDIVATFPPNVTKEEVPAMMQQMLASRFGLTFHRENKDQSVFALIVGPGGAKLTPAPADADAKVAAAAAAAAQSAGAQTVDTGANGKATVSRSSSGGASVTMTGGPNGPMQMEMGADGMHLTASHLTMSALADLLTGLAGRPVLDQTGLSGAYQVSIAVSQEDIMALARVQLTKLGLPLPPQLASQAATPSGNSILQAVQKLGLKLDARKSPVPTIVVDHISETATAN